LHYLTERLKARHLSVEFTAPAKKQLIDEGYDPAFGARPLKRVIQQRLENQLANELLAAALQKGTKSASTPTAAVFALKRPKNP